MYADGDGEIMDMFQLGGGFTPPAVQGVSLCVVSSCREFQLGGGFTPPAVLFSMSKATRRAFVSIGRGVYTPRSLNGKPIMECWKYLFQLGGGFTPPAVLSAIRASSSERSCFNWAGGLHPPQ